MVLLSLTMKWVGGAMANVRTRACGTIQNAHYCNLAVVGSNHVTNKKKDKWLMKGYKSCQGQFCCYPEKRMG